MSIIHEALKKTQDNRHLFQKSTNKEVVIPRSKQMKITVLIMFGILVTAFFTYQHFTAANAESQYHAMSSKKIALALQAQNSLKVNGTFFANRVKMAMINHQMYRVGDTVSDLQIIGIDTDSVKFRSNQGDLTMPVTA